MLNAKKLLNQFVGGQSGQTPGRATDWGSQIGELTRGLGGRGLDGLGGGALAGGLTAILLSTKGGRKLAGSALTIGGLAVVGAFAYQAYRSWRTGKIPADTQPTSGVPMLLPPAPATAKTQVSPSSAATRNSC